MVSDLSFEGVSKCYRIPSSSEGSPSGWLEKLRQRYLPPVNEFWAVRDLNFEVPRGQALGIIGHNGAGKSTMLKLLSGITAPSTGVITARGRLSALLEVGSGFHPELTGRENIFLSGSILGMSRKEIRQKLDSIIEFAEVRQFIDLPVKRYSSGMHVRLGFAIAAHLDPHILLLDEVLAVGDADFQQKCKKRILEMKRAPTTIVYISHDLHAVEEVCDRVLVVRQGQIIHDGTPQSAISFYNTAGRFHAISGAQNMGDRSVAITGLEILDEAGNPVTSSVTSGALRIQVHFTVNSPERARCRVVLHSPDWRLYCQVSTADEILDLTPGAWTVEFSCAALMLQPGVYMVDPVLERPGESTHLVWLKDCMALQVKDGCTVDGTFYQPHSWTVRQGG